MALFKMVSKCDSAFVPSTNILVKFTFGEKKIIKTCFFFFFFFFPFWLLLSTLFRYAVCLQHRFAILKLFFVSFPFFFFFFFCFCTLLSSIVASSYTSLSQRWIPADVQSFFGQENKDKSLYLLRIHYYVTPQKIETKCQTSSEIYCCIRGIIRFVIAHRRRHIHTQTQPLREREREREGGSEKDSSPDLSIYIYIYIYIYI